MQVQSLWLLTIRRVLNLVVRCGIFSCLKPEGRENYKLGKPILLTFKNTPHLFYAWKTCLYLNVRFLGMKYDACFRFIRMQVSTMEKMYPNQAVNTEVYFSICCWPVG